MGLIELVVLVVAAALGVIVETRIPLGARMVRSLILGVAVSVAVVFFEASFPLFVFVIAFGASWARSAAESVRARNDA